MPDRLSKICDQIADALIIDAVLIQAAMQALLSTVIGVGAKVSPSATSAEVLVMQSFVVTVAGPGAGEIGKAGGGVHRGEERDQTATACEQGFGCNQTPTPLANSELQARRLPTTRLSSGR
jgi:hypothetical protein